VKIIAILGAGPGLGLSVAKAFGRAAHRVALLARRKDPLDEAAARLAAHGIEARAYAADVTDPAQLETAVASIRMTLGEIDVLHVGPSRRFDMSSIGILDMTADTALDHFRFHTMGAINAARAVLPAMLDRKQGALFFTTGYSSVAPVRSLAAVGVAMSGVRSYARCLHEELAPRGIYVGHLAIGAIIRAGDALGDPDKLAALELDLVTKRDRFEEIIGPPPARS